ncbi:hypothetical protein ADIS_1467 [Lunatimonas lonarensis]|uniref:RHS repeat-associated core domain-containing protein n=1 Tax=Lunatimonas lonarensis TaxID=1232681 RepID=R7ZVD3_9BACT|nr:hypothetical protein ADIS_1467 [Lunatimonas lonarensis]
MDPLAPDYPWYTPYQYAGNKPVWTTDLDGLEERIPTVGDFVDGRHTFGSDHVSAITVPLWNKPTQEKIVPIPNNQTFVGRDSIPINRD